MSLIQQALEKAGKVQPPPAVSSAPKPVPVEVIHETLRHEEAIIQEMAPREERKRDSALIFFAAAGWAIFAAVAAAVLIWFLLTVGRKAQTSPVMLAGVSSSAAKVPQAAPKSGTPKFILTGVTESVSGKLALINNQVVGVGDRLQEKAFVKSIDENSAVLDYNGREVRLSL